MPKTVALIGSFDTKGPDYRFLNDEILGRGLETLLIDTSVVGRSQLEADVPSERVAKAAGFDLQELAGQRDRGAAVAAMAEGAAVVASELFEAGQIDGIVAMGGGAGTLVGTSAMRALPIGFPKVMVSTVASGDVSPYVGTSDIAMLHSVVDVAGVNRISRRIYANAAAAICAMTEVELPAAELKPTIAASMFGNTTRAVDQARELLEAEGYEVLVFHATGAGGRTMERLIGDGFFAGVLDMTTTELADELCGGVLSAGPERLEAAAASGTPQVVVPGCLDMCNFWSRDTVPGKYAHRTLYEWNPNVTLMRTDEAENRELAQMMARKLNAASGPTTVLIPVGGFSELDVEGGPFHAPEITQAFIEELRSALRPDIEVVELDADVNAPEFSHRAVQVLLEQLREVAVAHGP